MVKQELIRVVTVIRVTSVPMSETEQVSFSVALAGY